MAAARGILIQLRFAALYLMRYRLFQQILNKKSRETSTPGKKKEIKRKQ